MEFSEMKTLSEEQLIGKIAEWRKELYKVRLDANMQKKAEKPHMFPLLRKQIARAYTLIRQKQMQESTS